MKGQFPQFDPGAKVDYKNLWETALFVFDTNVLLNLYRYQTSTRDQLLDILEKLSDQIWIPHHVALEFQRNRFTVLADQNKRFSDVESVVIGAKEKLRNGLDGLQLERRHSLIDPAPLVDGFEDLSSKFLNSLKNIQKGQQKLNEPDPLKDRIEALFSGRVGPEIKSQDELNAIYDSAEKRYQMEIPPGYLDVNKDKKGPVEYVYGGIYYKRKYGDYLIWHQILSYAKGKNTESVVFVTDDAKDDWWWKVNSDGQKTLGPRPELREEASRLAGIAQFNMYKPEGFLTYSKEFLEPDISNEAIQEVRDVSSARTEAAVRGHKIRKRAQKVEKAVFRWLCKSHDEVYQNGSGFPDFLVREDGENLGFEVKLIANPKMMLSLLYRFFKQAGLESLEGDLDSMTFILVIESESEAMMLAKLLRAKLPPDLPQTVHFLVGCLDEDELGDAIFTPKIKVSADGKALQGYS